MKIQTSRQRNLMITTFLQGWKFSEFDAIKARNQMEELWGIDLDWHDFAQVLDEMSRCGQAERTGANKSGMTVYVIS